MRKTRIWVTAEAIASGIFSYISVRLPGTSTTIHVLDGLFCGYRALPSTCCLGLSLGVRLFRASRSASASRIMRKLFIFWVSSWSTQHFPAQEYSHCKNSRAISVTRCSSACGGYKPRVRFRRVHRNRTAPSEPRTASSRYVVTCYIRIPFPLSPQVANWYSADMLLHAPSAYVTTVSV